MPAEKMALPLAGNIRLLRKELKLSQAALGEQVGLTRSNIASYENAKAEPRAAKLAEIARFFNVSLERLITGDFSNRDPTETTSTLGRKSREDLRRHLATFDKRNYRLKRILSDLNSQMQSGGDPQAEADVQRISQHFGNMLDVMQELVRNDEELVGVLHQVSSEPAGAPII